jgi:hypothetical protein
MPDYHGLLFPERRDELHHITDIVDDRIRRNVLRRLRLAKSAHIRSNGVIPCFGKRAKLVPPRVPALWPSVAKKHQRTLTCFNEVEAKTA